MPIKKVFAVLLLALLMLPVFAFNSTESFLSAFPENLREDFFSGEAPEMYTVRGDKVSSVLPDGTIMKDLAEKVEVLDYAFSQSLSTFCPYPDSIRNLSDSEKLLAVFNLAQGISTVKGVTYLSHSSGYKEETLFSDAYFLSNPDKKNSRMDDPVSDSVPERQSSYAYLKDSRFGGNVYKIDYYCYNNEIFLEITNYKAMKYMGFKCVEKGNLHLYLDACLTDDGVIISGLAVAYNQKPEVNVLITTVDLPTAFLKRVASLKDWFFTRIENYGN